MRTVQCVTEILVQCDVEFTVGVRGYIPRALLCLHPGNNDAQLVNVLILCTAGQAHETGLQYGAKLDHVAENGVAILGIALGSEDELRCKGFQCDVIDKGARAALDSDEPQSLHDLEGFADSRSGGTGELHEL